MPVSIGHDGPSAAATLQTENWRSFVDQAAFFLVHMRAFNFLGLRNCAG